MESVAFALGLFILVCIAIISLAAALVCCVIAWDEAYKIMRHWRQRRAMDLRLEEWVASKEDTLP